MRIKICGFKCHIEVEYSFITNEMTLIKGQSGIGKSSILQSIFWALYGNMRSIYNNAGITKKLSVLLSFPGITIHRKKNPELLTVTTTDEKIYEDAIAQSIIDLQFGNREVWKACSYIEQQSRCSLLSGSGNERLELLNALSFTGENPKDYIIKINEKLKEVTNLFTTSQASFVTEINLYSSELKETPVTYTLHERDIIELKSLILKLEEKEKKTYDEVCIFERLQGTYNYLQSSLQTSKNLKINNFIETPKLDIIPEIEIVPSHLYIIKTSPLINDNIILSFEDYSTKKTSLLSDISHINFLISNKEKLSKELETSKKDLEHAQSKIISIPNVQELINTEIKQEEIWNASKLEEERIKNIKICEKLGIEYDQNVIQETLNRLTNSLSTFTNLERHVTNYKRLLSLEKDIDFLKSEVSSTNIKELELLSQKKSLLISDLKKGLELLSCPNCKTPLRYRGGNLSIGERDPVSPSEIQEAEEEYQKIEQLVTKARKLTNLEENAQNLNSSLEGLRNELDEYLKEGSKISYLTNLIFQVSNIEYITEVSLSSQILSDIYSFQKSYHNNNKLTESINSIIIEDNIEEKKKMLNEVEEKYKYEQQRLEKNQTLMKEYQNEESKRMKDVSLWEEKKRKSEKEKERIERSNQEKLIKHEKEKEERFNLNIEIEKKENELKIMEEDMNTHAKDEYQKVRLELEEKKKMLDASLYGNKMIERGKELEKKRNVLLNLQKDVESLTRLKLKAIEVECKQLEDTVNNINTILETTLPIFFNEPISLKLLLYKKIKTKKDSLKPGLNLEINYKGCKYDNINSLSGGEGDRISLALLLALNSVSNSPILLLDECVSSLDAELKEYCITAIKTIPNKTVICVDHDDTLEGFYDSVITI